MASSWQERNEAARAKGYKNYYDYRAHNYGRIPPERPALSGERLARAAGRAGPAGLKRALTGGRAELVIVTPTQRDKGGRFSQVSVDVTYANGDSNTYWIDDLDWLEDWWDDADLDDFVLLDVYNVTGGGD